MRIILNTIRWLGIVTGALSLFYLGNAWIEFGLGEVFTRVYAWYAGILHPVVELLKPVALWVVSYFGWSLPEWWKDVAVLAPSWFGASASGEIAAYTKSEHVVSDDGSRASHNAEFGVRVFVAITGIPAGSLLLTGLNAALG